MAAVKLLTTFSNANARRAVGHTFKRLSALIAAPLSATTTANLSARTLTPLATSSSSPRAITSTRARAARTTRPPNPSHARGA